MPTDLLGGLANRPDSCCGVQGRLSVCPSIDCCFVQEGMFGGGGGMIAKQVEEELTRNYGNYGRTKDVFSLWTSSAVGLDVVVEYRLGFVG